MRDAGPRTVEQRRAINIGNCSGAGGDGVDQLYRLATEGPIDAITADYLAEVNLATRALEMRANPTLGYEQGFLAHLKHENAAQHVAEKGIKIVHNGGALNPKGLYDVVRKLFDDLGFLDVKMAWVEGDDVMPQLSQARVAASEVPHLDIEGLELDSVKTDIVSANAYIGMSSVVLALRAGAQIVICGRICDATPVMALSSWWHDWKTNAYDQIAGSLIAGHLTECGPYITGGNFCGFKTIKNNYEVGYPIVCVEADGTCEVFMHPGANGAVTIDTVKGQLLYEIQGPIYLNPDVSADLSDVTVESTGENRVRLSGVKGYPPPPTTKLAVCALGGFQAELSTFANGLDIKEKVELQRTQVFRSLGDLSRFDKVDITAYGTSPPNPRTQAECTVMIRHFVQAQTRELCIEFGMSFLKCGMGAYAGFYPHMDMRTLFIPKPFIRYFPGKVDLRHLDIKAHIEGAETAAPPFNTDTRPFMGQPSYDTRDPVDLTSFGPMMLAPLGSVVLARSGDKGGNANVGFWVRREDEYPWLKNLLSISTFKNLLADDLRPEYRVERFEMPGIHAVHFVTYGILQDGVSSSSVLDGFAKSFGEFLRAREVEVPIKFLERGWL